jgi:hypothetical protein
VAVTGLEYLNEENIAVTILYAAFTEYDPLTGRLHPNATNATYKVQYISTQTMMLSSVPHNRDVLDSSVAQGQLCPAMRRLPNLGSIWAESLTTLVNLFRPVISIIVSLPGLIEVWQQGRACSLNTQGHSLLRKCGAEILSLDDFFESLTRANIHYWGAFNLIAQAIRGEGQHQLANIVDGVAYYGDATSSPVRINMMYKI